ncbi:Protein of unknown function [Gryllus bimaculatus]|nr:Protein of unknown function [Gryllus bimaculatus]
MHREYRSSLTKPDALKNAASELRKKLSVLGLKFQSINYLTRSYNLNLDALKISIVGDNVGNRQSQIL